MAVSALTIFIVPANQQLDSFTPFKPPSSREPYPITRLQRYAPTSNGLFHTYIPPDIKCLCKKCRHTSPRFIYTPGSFIYSLEYMASLPFGGPLALPALEKGRELAPLWILSSGFLSSFEIIKTTSLVRP